MKTAVSALPTRTSVAPLLVPALLACYVIWGSTYLAIRFALQGFPPFFQMASRFLVAGGLLIGWVLWRDGVAGLPTRRQWLHALVIGGLMLGGGMGLIAQAEVHISSGLIATFVAVVPMMVSAWGLLFGKRPTGIALVAASTACWSLGSVLSTNKFPLAPGVAGFASEMLCGGVLLMALAVATREQPPAWPLMPVPTLAWLYLVVFGSIVAFCAYMYLLAHASAAVATSYAFVNPVIALLLGVAIGAERVTPWEWTATGVVLAGVVLIFLGKRAVGRGKT